VQWVSTGADGMAHVVAVTPDVSDLLALPAAAIPVMLAARASKHARCKRHASDPGGC
jgi:hypothetical protein